MLKRLALVSSVLLLTAILSLPAVAAKPKTAAPLASTAGLPVIDYEKYRLKNGLEVILAVDRRLPLTSVNIWYHVGPANEAAGRTGFAHLFEHMMFAATKHLPRGAADSLLEEAGVTDSNGSTSFDRTNYFDTVPSNRLELALWIHSDRMGYLLDVLDQTALANQQDVVRNERRQTYENRPYGVVEEALWHQLFPKSHPYHAAIIGSHADIQAAGLTDIKSFFKAWYRPNNATLTIVGDIDKAKTKALVEKYFGGFAPGPKLRDTTVKTPSIKKEKRAVIEDRVELERVIMGWHTPKINAPGDAELTLAGQILGGGRSSRLYKSLVYEKQIAQDVSAGEQALQLGSVFAIDVTARPGHTAKKIEAAIDAELAKLRATPVTKAELARARNTLEAGMIALLEKVSSRADLLNHYNHYTGDPGYFHKEIAAYRRVTPAGIRKAVRAWLAKQSRVVIHGVPGTPDFGPEVPTPAPVVATAAAGPASSATESLNSAEEWRKEAPKPDKPRRLVLPQGETFTLANGLTVIHHRKTSLPLVSAQLVIKAGNYANPAGKPGLASFTADLLDEGTASASAQAIADTIAGLGASLEVTATPDATIVQLFSLKKNFSKAADVLADVILRPSFPEAEVERQRASRLTELVQNQDNPAVVAGDTMLAALYGNGHPYGFSTLGNEAAIGSTTRAELRTFWQQHYRPNNAALIVVGDLTPAEVRQLAQSRFGEWQSADIAAPASSKPATTPARLVIVDKPGTPQTALRVALIGVDRQTDDFAALEVLNAALGGLFTSRLNTNLREQKGYSYGAHSGFQYRREPGPFEIRTSVRTDVTGAAVQEILREIDGLKTRPIVDGELQKARDSQLLSLPGAFETNAGIAGNLAETFIYNLGANYYAELPEQIRAVDAIAVAAAGKRYLDPDNFKIISVGDKAAIEPQFGVLKLGPVEYRQADGTPVKKP